MDTPAERRRVAEATLRFALELAAEARSRPTRTRAYTVRRHAHRRDPPDQELRRRQAAPGRRARRRRGAARSPRRCSPTCWSRCRRTAAIDEVVVVTGDNGAQRIAGGYGATVVDDSDEAVTTSAAANGRAARAQSAGPSGCCWSPATARCSTPSSSTVLIASARPASARCVIVPDRHGTGTNALLLTPPDVIARVRRGQPPAPRGAAKAAGAAVEVVEVPSLALDVDTPEDLDALRDDARRRPGGAARTRGMLDRCAGEPRLTRRRGGARRDARDPARRRPRSADRAAAATPGGGIGPATCVVVAHKVVSKAEGRIARSPRSTSGRAGAAARRGARQGPAPRPGGARRVAASCCAPTRGVLICLTRHGFVCANAGVDASNAPDAGHAGPAPARPRRARRGACAPASRAASACDPRW